MFLGPNLTESHMLADAFNVLTILQPEPFPGSLAGQLVPL